jgi:hypothetical protein
MKIKKKASLYRQKMIWMNVRPKFFLKINKELRNSKEPAIMTQVEYKPRDL